MPHAGGAAPTRISSVLGEEREGLGRHTFLGGNFFMLRMLNRYRGELGVEALPQELDAAAHATIAQLQQDTATVSVVRAGTAGGRLDVEVSVRNLTGHKLPTGYPSRRAWLHLTVRDRENQVVFSSGEITPSGLIRGNDNDADADTVRAALRPRFAARTRSRSTNPVMRDSRRQHHDRPAAARRRTSRTTDSCRAALTRLRPLPEHRRDRRRPRG